MLTRQCPTLVALDAGCRHERASFTFVGFTWEYTARNRWAWRASARAAKPANAPHASLVPALPFRLVGSAKQLQGIDRAQSTRSASSLLDVQFIYF